MENSTRTTAAKKPTTHGINDENVSGNLLVPPNEPNTEEDEQEQGKNIEEETDEPNGPTEEEKNEFGG